MEDDKREKTELQKLKEMSWKKKIGYVWDYYKMPIAAVVVVLIVIATGVSQYKSSKVDTVLYTAMINTQGDVSEDSDFYQQVKQVLQVEDGTEEIVFDNSFFFDLDYQSQMTMATITKILAMVSSQDIDIMIAPKEVYDYYLKQEFFADLEEILPEELQEEERFLMGKGENDTEEHAYAMSLEGNQVLEEAGITGDGEVLYLMIPVNTGHTEETEAFVRFLLSKD